EVVRGPQGTLLGKNTTIGAVIVKTARPSFDPSLKVSASYGENNAWQVRANATGPLVDDKLAARLTFATSQGGGWIPNKV
ncbi:TonB-dependent receptor, partial [Klebsiella pneumoniae]